MKDKEMLTSDEKQELLDIIERMNESLDKSNATIDRIVDKLDDINKTLDKVMEYLNGEKKRSKFRVMPG
jgi:chromosome segregation ATPase